MSPDPQNMSPRAPAVPPWAFNWHRDRHVLSYALIVGIAIWTYGLDNGETSGFLAMQAFLKDFGEFVPTLGYYNMSAGEQTRMYGIELGVALLGCLAAGVIGARFGRKVGLVITAILCMLGPAIQMISHVAAMLVGRALLGAGAGFAGVLAVAYWSEVAPAALRGRIVIFYQLFINLAAFIGACINQGTYKRTTAMAYRIPLIVAVIFPCLLLVSVWLIPESPRWLVTRNRLDEAKTNLRKIRGEGYTQEEIDKEMKDTIAFTAIEMELEGSISFFELFKGTNLRRTIIAVVLFLGEQMMGVGFLGGYITYFFFLVGFTDAFAVSVISSACSIAGSLVSLFAIQYCGRRILLIVGAAVIAFCMFAFAIINAADPLSKGANRTVAAFICIFTFTYSATWGTVVPIVAGEVPSNRLRSKSLALSFAFNWAGATLVICGTPYLIQPAYANLGTKVGFIFGGLTVPLFLFVLFCVPETKGRTLEEIDEMFLNRVATRKFKTYVCTGDVGNLSEDAVYRSIENKGSVSLVE